VVITVAVAVTLEGCPGAWRAADTASRPASDATCPRLSIAAFKRGSSDGQLSSATSHAQYAVVVKGWEMR
jgi:hypothetical protein